MSEKLYRVWDRTDQEYVRTNHSNNRFYHSLSGAKTGIQWYQKKWWTKYKDHEFDIREYIAIPTDCIKELETVLLYIAENNPEDSASIAGAALNRLGVVTNE